MRPHAVHLALSLVLLPACGSAGGRVAYAVRDSAGVRIVTNGERGAWTPDQAWSFVPDATYPAAGADSAPMLGGVAGLAVTAAGHTVLFDAADVVIRQYDSAGRYLRGFGGKGTGPGEFSGSQMSVLVGRGDSIIVPDFGNRRISVFTPDGKFARMMPIALTGVIPARWGALPDGGLAEQAMVLYLKGDTAKQRENVILRLGADGAVRDTLLPLPGDPVLDLGAGPAGAKTPVFESQAAWRVRRDGALIEGMTGNYRLTLRDSTGKVVMIFGREDRPVPVTEQEKETFRGAYRTTILAGAARSGNQEMRKMADQLVANLEFPANYPAFMSILPAPDGGWLVRRVRTIAEAAKGKTAPAVTDLRLNSSDWDLFDSAGRYLGVVGFPRSFEPAGFVGRQVYGIQFDSLGTPVVARVVRR